MVVAAIFLLLAAQAQPPLTLVMVRALSPMAAGNAILGDRSHAPIQQVVQSRATGLVPPGIAELELVEQAMPASEGCTRTRWIVAFRRQPGMAPDAAILSGARPTTEIALSRGGRCPNDRYAGLNIGTAPSEAFASLKRLDALRAGESGVRFACTDETASGLCATPGAIRHGLAAIAPWQVTRRGGTMILWLGTPGQIVTEVSYDLATPQAVSVRRYAPPPA